MIILVVFAGGLSVFDCDFRIWRSHIDVVGSYRSLSVSSLSALVMSHLFTSVNLGGFLFHRLFFHRCRLFFFIFVHCKVAKNKNELAFKCHSLYIVCSFALSKSVPYVATTYAPIRPPKRGEETQGIRNLKWKKKRIITFMSPPPLISSLHRCIS